MEKVARHRLNAIKEDRNISALMKAATEGTETMESIKPKIDAEVKAAKELGLNFNIMCRIWLFNVGIQFGDQTSVSVSKYLNRCLSLRLNKQGLMTNYFMKHLESEIYAAKNSGKTCAYTSSTHTILFLLIRLASRIEKGKYDVGIRQVEGNRVEFVEKPRTFCFGGLAAKDERVYVYRVAVDSGITAEKALEMYNEAKETELPQPIGRNGWLGRGARVRIATGFYIDQRDYLSRRVGWYGKKVFLVIDPGAHSTNCIIVRPNIGRYMKSKYEIHEDIRDRNWTLQGNVNRAMEVWERE